jgi:hypothetical protein
MSHEPEAIIAITMAIKNNWPNSTPTLKNSKAIGIELSGNPVCASALAALSLETAHITKNTIKQYLNIVIANLCFDNRVHIACTLHLYWPKREGRRKYTIYLKHKALSLKYNSIYGTIAMRSDKWKGIYEDYMSGGRPCWPILCNLYEIARPIPRSYGY